MPFLRNIVICFGREVSGIESRYKEMIFGQCLAFCGLNVKVHGTFLLLDEVRKENGALQGRAGIVFASLLDEPGRRSPISILQTEPLPIKIVPKDKKNWKTSI